MCVHATAKLELMVNTVVHKEEGKEETLRAAISGDADVTIEISTPETNALLQPSSTTSTGVLRNKKQSQEPGIELTKIDRNKKDKIDVDTASSLNTSSSVTPAVECSLRSTAPHCRICLSEGTLIPVFVCSLLDFDPKANQFDLFFCFRIGCIACWWQAKMEILSFASGAPVRTVAM